MANSSNDSPPSLSSDIERANSAKTALPFNEEERMDLHRVQEDAREYRKQLARIPGGTEPASA
jgi:hypothetical protein